MTFFSLLSRAASATLCLLFVLTFYQNSAAEAADEVNSTPASNSYAIVASLSDEQVRQMLLDELRKEGGQQESSQEQNLDVGAPSDVFGRILGSLATQTDDSELQLQSLWAGVPNILPDLYDVFLALCPNMGPPSFAGAFKNFLFVLLVITIGLAAELFIKKFVLAKYFQPNLKGSEHLINSEKISASITRELPDFIGLFFFFGVSYLAFFLFSEIHHPHVRLFFLAILLTVSLIRVISICSHIILSPSVLHFRLLPIDCNSARSVHRLVLWTTGYIISGLMLSAVTKRLGAETQTVLLQQLFFASLLLTFTGIGVLYFKKRIQRYIIGDTQPDETSKGLGRRQFAAVWHFIAILYLVALWLLLVKSIADPDQSTKGAFILSFFVVPLWMAADQLIQLVVRYALSTLNIHQTSYENEPDTSEEVLAARENGKNIYLKINRIARTGVIVSLLVWVAGLWNINFPFLYSLSTIFFDGIIIMALALLLWRFINSWIERKIQESIPEDEEDSNDDGEFGSAPTRGRAYTLLPMVRKFIGTVLVVMATMTILSSMGVDIGPLLAGAGVLGLAIGFGAQKIVADIFSGFFFLLDDAFRVGEYLTAGSVSGTVEEITLRNVMLRHHRGMLQIIPHSDMGAVTNFMRGGMVVKFNLDFPYDANIDQIRKVIKKVGQAMLNDEELGADFIRPVKSQGVYQITNSVMTIRVKFTAKPGTHFVIRREAYRRITEALAARGIHYAHKKVIVDVPGLNEAKLEGKVSGEQVQAITSSVGAAAIATINEEEEQAAKAAAAAPTQKSYPR